MDTNLHKSKKQYKKQQEDCIYRFLILFNFNFIKDNSLKVMNNRIFCECRQAFTMTNNMSMSGLWENVILTNIIITVLKISCI